MWHRFRNTSGDRLTVHARSTGEAHPEQVDVDHDEHLTIEGELDQHPQGHVVRLHDTTMLLPSWHWQHDGSSEATPD